MTSRMERQIKIEMMVSEAKSVKNLIFSGCLESGCEMAGVIDCLTEDCTNGPNNIFRPAEGSDRTMD